MPEDLQSIAAKKIEALEMYCPSMTFTQAELCRRELNLSVNYSEILSL